MKTLLTNQLKWFVKPIELLQCFSLKKKTAMFVLNVSLHLKNSCILTKIILKKWKILKELKDQRQLIEDLAINQQKLQQDQDAIRTTVSEISKAMGLQETPSPMPSEYNYYA